MVVFTSGILLILALFIPLSMLQDSRPQRVQKTVRTKTVASRCTDFSPPHAPVGSYDCQVRRPGTHNEMQACWLVCPASMDTRPNTETRLLYRCHNGKWKLVKDPELHCVAKTPVNLVAQQMASPELLNSLLHSYLNHSYGYLAMASIFDRGDVELPGFHKYMMGMWEKSMSKARDVMSYINKRGGWIDLLELPRTSQSEKMHVALAEGHVGLAAMTTALAMEREAQELIMQIMDRVDRRSVDDPHLLHVLEDQHLSYKVQVIKELADHITQLQAFDASDDGDYELGEYQMDNTLQ